jgi:hypothetical protein
MLIIAHGRQSRLAPPPSAPDGDLHALRAKRHRADDFGLV